MALTPAEKQRAYRDRKRIEVRAAARTGQDDLAVCIVTPFPAYWSSDAERAETSFIAETLASIGLDLNFADDADPECDAGHSGSGESRGALGRAERAVGALLDSAVALAGIVNRFKLAEIDRALASIAQADLSTPDAKAQAFRNATALEGLKNALNKEVRRSLPPTVIAGGTATV